MQRNQDIPWLRLGAESVAIVVSILLAFSLNAWWENRLERELESQQLTRLQVELVTNIELMDEFRFADSSINTGLRVIEMMEDAQASETVDIMITAASLFNLTRASTLEIETSVFDCLVRSGSLDVIRDQQIVSALAAWERTVRNYADLAVVSRATTETILLPALHRRANTSFALTRVIPRSPDDDREGETEVSLSVDNEIMGLIAQKTAILRTAARALTDMREAAEAAIEAIDAAEQ